MSSEIKRMSDLLRSGATMLSEICPECGSPLFKVKNDIVCVKCNKPVVMVKATEQEGSVVGGKVLEELEQTMLSKIKGINSALSQETDVERLNQYGKILSTWLDALDKIRRLRLA